jgi:hypothetical protein
MTVMTVVGATSARAFVVTLGLASGLVSPGRGINRLRHALDLAPRAAPVDVGA